MTPLPSFTRVSLRHVLLAITGAFTLMTATMAVSELTTSARRLEEVTQLSHVTDLTNKMFLASESLALERDIALSLLSSDSPEIDGALLPALSEVRRDADARRDDLIAALPAENTAEILQWRRELEARTQEIAGLRAEVDSALNGAPASAADLPARWNAATSAALGDIGALWVLSVRRYTNIDPIITQYLRFNHFLRVIFDYSGRERSLVAQIIASRQEATPEQNAELFRGDGVLQTSWSMSLVLAQQSGLYAEIEPVYLDARSHYEMLHGMLEETFYAPRGASQQAFPLTLPFWLELSQEARESLLTLRQAARAQMSDHVDGLIADSQRAIATQAALLTLALLFCLLSIWVTTRHVIRPIENIIAVLLRAVTGERVDFTEPSTSKEIGKLVDVLHAFQTKVEEVRTGAANLDRSERRLRAVVDNAADGLITIDARGGIQAFNPACERFFGYSAAEVIGRNISALMPEPHSKEHDAYLARYVGAGEARVIGVGRELLARRKDGSVFPIDLSVSGIELPEGRYFLGIIRDITLRKEAEASLHAHTHALERSNKELDDFAYIASHDLKEPLRGIHNHARFLIEDNEGKLDDDSTRRLNRLLYLSQRMEQLVNDLLYFSRLGRHELAIQSADLGDVIEDIEGTLEHFLAENNASLNIAAPLPTIRCDKTRVTEVLRNLVTNAVKYNESREKVVEIGVAYAKRMPDGAIARRAFYVADNGMGIAPEFHQEVFRIFKRLHGRTSEKDGTGVGLTFVKKIVERHGGRVWIESQLGEGATFYFTLETPDASLVQQAA